MNNTGPISAWQVTTIVAKTLIGVSVLSLPGIVAQNAGVDAWIVTLVSGILFIVAAAILAKLCQTFPNLTLVEFLELILGKVLGKVLALIYLVYFLVITGLVLRSGAEVIRQVLWYTTPHVLAVIIFLVLSVYLLINGVQALARLEEILLPVILIVTVLIIILTLQNANFAHLKPVLAHGMQPVFKSMINTVTAYLGYGVVFFLGPFMKQPEKLVSAAVKGVGIAALLYLIIVVVNLAVFRAEALANLSYAMLTLTRTVETTGSFFERLDLPFVSLWVVSIFATIAPLYFAAAAATHRILKVKEWKWAVLALLPVIYFIAEIPRNFVQLNKFFAFTAYAGLVFEILIPALLLILVRVRRLGGANDDQKSA